MYLLDKLWVTDKAVPYIFEKILSPWTIYFMLLDQGKLMGVCLFLCSGRQSFTMVFHELHLEISCSCPPSPQALWPGIVPLSMLQPKGGVTLFVWPALACLRSSYDLFAPGNLELGKWAAQPAFSWIWEWLFMCLPCPTYFFFSAVSFTALGNIACRD